MRESALLTTVAKVVRDHQRRRHRIQGHNVIEDLIETVRGKMEKEVDIYLKKTIRSQQKIIYA